MPDTTMPGTAAPAAVHHPIFARFYAWMSPRMEQAGYAERRDQLLAGLAGRVIEVGAGNGMNFGHYPSEVTQLVAVEPEPHLRRLAVERVATAPVPIEVIDGDADRLPVEDASFDAAVVSLVLCSVPDPARALAEIHRVLRAGGQLRFFEHVRAETAGLLRVQRALDASFWPTCAGGCHTSRDTRTAIQQAGFTIRELESTRMPATRIPLPASPHILGRATKT